MNPSIEPQVAENPSEAAQNLRLQASDALAIRGAPVPSALSSRFADYVDAKTRPYIRAVIVIGALGYTMFLLGDLVVAPDVFWSSLLLRTLFLAVVMVLTHFMVSRGRNIYLLEVVGAVYVHIAALIWYFLLFQSASPDVGVYSFASVIFVLWMNLGFSVSFRSAVVASCSLTALLMGGVWMLSSGSWVTIFIYGSLHASVLVFSLVVSWYNSFNQRRLFLFGIIDESKNTELREANRKLWSQAHSDPLTGLPNRPLLEDRLNQALAAAQRSGRKVGVLFIDLDRFKPVNDNYGHEVGDRVLRAVADRMSGMVRDADTLARVGGDEFVVVLTSIRNEEEALAKAGELIEAVAAPFHDEDRTIHIGCSIGIAMYPEHAQDSGLLRQMADQAVYAAKANGRNCAELAETDGGSVT